MATINATSEYVSTNYDAKTEENSAQIKTKTEPVSIYLVNEDGHGADEDTVSADDFNDLRFQAIVMNMKDYVGKKWSDVRSSIDDLYNKLQSAVKNCHQLSAKMEQTEAYQNSKKAMKEYFDYRKTVKSKENMTPEEQTRLQELREKHYNTLDILLNSKEYKESTQANEQFKKDFNTETDSMWF